MPNPAIAATLSARALQIRAECAREARDRAERLAVAGILSTANPLPTEGQASQALKSTGDDRLDWPQDSCFYCGANSAFGCRHQQERRT